MFAPFGYALSIDTRQWRGENCDGDKRERQFILLGAELYNYEVRVRGFREAYGEDDRE